MKTKRILTSRAKPGMVIAEDVYTYNNQLIIAKDTMLTNRAITRLKFYSITDIKIHVDVVNMGPIETKISFTEEIKQTSEYQEFADKHSETVSTLKDSLFSFVNKATSKLDLDALSAAIEELISASRNGTHVFHMLQCMRDLDDITYVHSVNVALICYTIGTWLHYNESDLHSLLMCGLLHDIGKLLVPHEIIQKPTALTAAEYKVIKTHSYKGYDIMKDQPIDMRIKLCALMHHERCDGSGYPNQLKGDEIIEFAKIVAIADTYDAMTSARAYRAPMCPFEVINIFETEGLHKYDPHILLTFLHEMAETYIHSNVILNNGQEGKVVMINSNSLSKPIVSVGNEFHDLSKETFLSIARIV
ncbi:HD-GYP domain-containing protein [[Clostridium] polysaccharolyticum]|jgi:HD-GYP domain-containing protein (c-di-GMP phosphodiesterase class II)|uniref:HD-GYP domain, c-di-GMP phosphodiesterase class II (Or its inactivated variant) n=1 Tax=[Clostridium] polysaccharolyticum TaxID=29364 RepID=A0A1I0EUI4_9FIRM|nr:HD-GYP domain-containing protein [[Clostridium] polysaccharolyticum]SET48265.1 HD-GYP domain, c-di-GMP phosphodiesterase class II (or its inactivated variant) [[Clostridium] polysaccharolyticum]